MAQCGLQSGINPLTLAKIAQQWYRFIMNTFLKVFALAVIFFLGLCFASIVGDIVALILVFLVSIALIFAYQEL